MTETGTIEIPGLSTATIDKLEKRAEKVGATASEYVRYLIEEDVDSPISLRVLYAPVRDQIKADCLSDDELDLLLEGAREEVYQAKLGNDSR
jgi:hypothetical protein